MSVTQAIAEVFGVEVTKEHAKSIAKLMEAKLPRKGKKVVYVSPCLVGSQIRTLLHTTEGKFFFYEGIRKEDIILY